MTPLASPAAPPITLTLGIRSTSRRVSRPGEAVIVLATGDICTRRSKGVTGLVRDDHAGEV
jgi:hypothetical protein